MATGFGEINGRRSAEVSYTLRSRLTGVRYLVLFSTPVDDLSSSVSLVEHRILTGGAIAIAAAALLAVVGSYALTRRLRRLQGTAERLAAGSFDVPIVDEGNDEIADLARSLDAMRIQLGRLEQARRTFIANASHELRTPLTALGGFLELASEHDADPAARDGFLATMREQVDRLAKLATDLLDLSRLDAGGVAVAQEEIELAAIAEDCVRELRGVAARRGSTVTAYLGTGEVHARGDDARVRQILRALLDNSLRHTPGGQPHRRHRRARSMAPRSSRWPTTARASRRTTRIACSSASTARRTRRRRGAGSALRSPTSSRGAWAAASRSRPSPAIRASRSSCPLQARRVPACRPFAIHEIVRLARPSRCSWQLRCSGPA